tara:strand:- start:759 stop:863 length:105 start_codon:yes stop_codon:yes gene_type:complete
MPLEETLPAALRELAPVRSTPTAGMLDIGCSLTA